MRIFTGVAGLVFCVLGVLIIVVAWPIVGEAADRRDIAIGVFGIVAGVGVVLFGILHLYAAVIEQRNKR